MSCALEPDPGNPAHTAPPHNTARIHPDAGLVGPRILTGEPPLDVWFECGRVKPWTLSGLHVAAPPLAGVCATDFVSGACCLVDAALLRDRLRFDEDYFHYVEDVDLGAQVRARGRRPLVELRATVIHEDCGSQKDEDATILGMRRRQLEWITAGKARFAKKWLKPWERLGFSLLAWVGKPLVAVLRGAGVGWLPGYWRATGGLWAARIEWIELSGGQLRILRPSGFRRSPCPRDCVCAPGTRQPSCVASGSGSHMSADKIQFLGQVRIHGASRRRGAVDVVIRDLDARRELGRVPVDGAGRFRWVTAARDHHADDRLEFVAVDRFGGRALGSQRTSAAPRSGFLELAIDLDPEAAQRGWLAHTPTRERGGVRRLPRGTVFGMRGLDVLAAPLRRAPRREGRPLVPRSIQTAILELNRAGEIALAVVEGDTGRMADFGRAVGGSVRGSAGGAGFARASGAGLLGGFASRFSKSGLLCAVESQGALSIVAAGLLADAQEARLGNLTQPGMHTQSATAYLHERLEILDGFHTESLKFQVGRQSYDEFRSRAYPGGSREPEEELGDWLVGYTPWPDGSGGGGLGDPDNGPGLGRPVGGRIPDSDPPVARDLRCLDWLDCADQMESFANSYAPPVVCPHEDTIGSITPVAVCEGDTDVVIEVRPKPGQEFEMIGGVCTGYLYRDPSRHRQLETLSFDAELIRLKLDKADYTGWVGFRGAGGASTSGVGSLRSCLQGAGILGEFLEALVGSGRGAISFQQFPENTLRMVSPPEVVSFGASWEQGSSSWAGQKTEHLEAEACTPVALAWNFTLHADEHLVSSEEYISVEIRDDKDQLVEAELPAQGTFDVNESRDRTYTLTATSRVGDEVCGKEKVTLSVGRFHKVHLRLLGGAQLQIGEQTNLVVRISCPAPIPSFTVELFSGDPTRLPVPESVEIPDGETQVIVPVQALGNDCASVTVTAQAVGHESCSLDVLVYRAPSIDSISPEVVRTCTAFDLQLNGSCFDGDQTLIWAERDGEQVALPVQAGSQAVVYCGGEDLPSGDWTIVAESRGLRSGGTPLTALPSVPQVDAFQAELVDLNGQGFEPCEPNGVIVTWSVRDASKIVLRKEGVVFDEDVLDGCGPAEGGTTTTVDKRTRVVLEAHPVGGGSSVDRVLYVGPAGVSGCIVHNLHDGPVLLWIVEGHHTFLSDIPHSSEKRRIESGETTAVQFEDCEAYSLYAIDIEAAEDQDKDPEGDAIEIQNLHRLPLGASPFVGQEDGEVVTVQVP